VNSAALTTHRSGRGSRARVRRAFNIVELLIALAISAALLTATMAALDASFFAYQRTTEVASTHTIGRLALHRMLALIRTGTEFGPFPIDPKIAIVESDFMQFRTPDGTLMEIEWVEDVETGGRLDVTVDGETYVLMEGVLEQFDPDDPDVRIYPFTLEYELGYNLYRATIDLAVVPDDNMDVTLDGANTEVLRLIGTAMPRSAAFE